MSNTDRPSGLLPELDSGHFPPPPPGPPPSLQQPEQYYTQYQQSDYPGQTQHQTPAGQQTHDEKPQNQSQQAPSFPPPPSSEHQSNAPQQQQQSYNPTGTPQYQPQQSFPPPPPQPSGQHQLEHEFFPPPPPLQQHQPQQQQQQQQQQSSYSIPAYDPANPVFAPPPSSNPNAPIDPQQQTAGSGHEYYHGQQAQHGPPGQQTQYGPPGQQTQHGPPGQQTQHGSHGEDGQTHQKASWSQRFSQLSMKAAAPINSIAHKLGSQSFLPETMDKECDKAAAILKAFCKKGVYADPGASDIPTSTDPHAAESDDGIIDPTREKPKSRVIVTIPPKVISKAVGLAIFTTLRAGFQVSGETGSGILISRLPDGSWSPPSGIQLHSVGGGFQIGLDIYDCVCVINSREALAAFTNTRVSLGTDLAVVAGPYGAGAAVDFGTALSEPKSGGKPKTPTSPSFPPAPDSKQTQQTQQSQQGLQPPDKADKKGHRRSLSASATKPVFSYVKSRGFYAGVRIDGTVVAERKDANAAFYGQSVSVNQILNGQVPAQGPHGMWPAGAQSLYTVLKGAEAGVAPAPSSSAPGPKTGQGIPSDQQQQYQPPGQQSTSTSSYQPAAGGYGAAMSGGAGGGHQEERLPGYTPGDHRPIDGDVKYT